MSQSVNPLYAVAREAAVRHGIQPVGYLNLIQRESGWNPNAVSPAGALGLLQIMPATAADLGVDPMDPKAAIEAGAAYLVWARSWLKGQGVPVESWDTTLAAYNGGIGNVRDAWNAKGMLWLDDMPAETQAYVAALAPSFDTPSGADSSPPLLPRVGIGGGILLLAAALLWVLTRGPK